MTPQNRARRSWRAAGLLAAAAAAAATGLAVYCLPGLAEAAPAFDPEAATRGYLDTLTPEQKAKSDAYFEGGYWLMLWGFLIGAGVQLGLLHLGLSARMRDVAERITKVRAVHTAVYWLFYLVLTTAVTFPWTLYTDFFREHQYELANQPFGEWFGEQLLGLVFAAVLGGVAVVGIYAIVRRAPKTWWVWGTLMGIVFSSAVATMAPVFIMPAFNTYEPLAEGPVKTAVLRMAESSGIATRDIYKSDASKQSKRISANVSGFLGTERITLNDNLLQRCSQAEIEAVMGHEIGHYVLNHVYEGILFFACYMLGLFAFLGLGFRWLVARFGERWGVRDISDVAGLPVLVLLASVAGFVSTPIMNTYVRANEAEADIFGLNAARQPDGFAEVSLKLGEYRKLEPGSIEEFLFFDHPSGRSRILMAMKWKAAMLAAGAIEDERAAGTERAGTERAGTERAGTEREASDQLVADKPD